MNKKLEHNIQTFDSSKVFFTSDTHFGHNNIIKGNSIWGNRCFASIDEHDKTIIDNWNACVGKDDIVFHLGDFCFGNISSWEKYRHQLNGQIYLIYGNHDMRNVALDSSRMKDLFVQVVPQMLIQIDGRKVYMNHYPFLCYAGTFDENKTIQLFGHVHSSPTNTNGQDVPRLAYLFDTQYDVGVENNNYCPVTFSEILKRLNNDKNKENIRF